MPKSLMIVESAAKAKTINKFLGKNYTVKATIGHIKDLPPKRFGVDIEHDFQPEYATIRGRGKVIAEIKRDAKEAEKIYLATDPDREGEAIAWHIAQELNGNDSRVYRVLFNEITEKGITTAIANPGRIDLNKVNAQQARRVLDRVVGYKISPILWEKVRGGLSAGRVQSVAVRLICEREREITTFVSKEYWSVTAHLEGKVPPIFDAKLNQIGDEKAGIGNERDARALTEEAQAQSFIVEKVTKKERKRNPAPPFITSTLQQEAAKKLHFTAKKTMMIAQRLYEGIEIGEEGPVGLITYMRTDSTRIADEAIREARGYIEGHFGKEYLPREPIIYKSKKGAQDAHEGIRPTSVHREPDAIKQYLQKDEYALYKLIWTRFIASQMNPAILDVTTIDIKAGRLLFRATGTVIRFLGFTKVYVEEREKVAEREEGEEREGQLPPLEAGEHLKCLGIEPKQHFTEPPPRYTEASLIKELEEKGIGRPSTYAPILSTIQARKYVEKKENKFHPTELGFLVTDLLVKHFPNILDVKFTARMEGELDEIEDGERGWVEAVRDFYTPFEKDLKKAHVEMKNVKKETTLTDIICEKCGNRMVIKWGRNGKFLACSGYPECKNTKEFVQADTGKIRIVEAEKTEESCPECGRPMVIKKGRYGRFLACSDYPRCKTTKPVSTGVSCPKEGCGGYLIEKGTKRGKVFYACSKYPACDYALWDKPIQKRCPLCNAPFLVERRTRGGELKVLCLSKECGYREGGV